MKKIKTFWEKHKTKIIVGGGVILTTAMTVILIQSSNKKNIGIMTKVEDFNFGFNNLEEALDKFKELGMNAPNGTIALWYKGMDGFEYLVQDLS